VSDHWPTVTLAEANDFMKSKTVETAKRASGSLQPDCSARALAAKIAAALFTSGDGKRAERLVFQLGSGEDWGGWSEPAAANYIAKIIEAQNTAHERPAISDNR
jgi:hypothetical protein